MKTLNRFRERFDEGVMRRGELYHKLGKVKSVQLAGGKLTGRVSGESDYTSELSFDGQTIRYRCTCPYIMDRGEPCKHLWATLLAAEQGGQLAILFNQPQAKDSHWRRAWSDLKTQFERSNALAESMPVEVTWPDDRRLVYAISPRDDDHARGSIHVFTQRRSKNGTWGSPKRMSLPVDQWLAHPDPQDRDVALILNGSPYPANSHVYNFSASAEHDLLRRLCQTDRFFLRIDSEDFLPILPLRWDESPERFTPAAALSREKGSSLWRLELTLRRGQSQTALSQAAFIGESHVVVDNVVGRTSVGNPRVLRSFETLAAKLKIPHGSLPEFVSEWNATPHSPSLAVPEETGVREVKPACRPLLQMRRPTTEESHNLTRDALVADLSFQYDTTTVTEGTPGRALSGTEEGLILLRDPAAETSASELLRVVGFRFISPYYGSTRAIPRTIRPDVFAEAVTNLITRGWDVKGEYARYSIGSTFDIEVSSGIDWFDVTIKAGFDGRTARVPDLLAALRSGKRTVTLDDGSTGVLPEEWLAKYAALAALGGEVDGQQLRVERSRGGLLDAMLAALPAVTCDETFQKLQEEIRAFDKIDSIEPPPGFIGTLRPYQKMGLGWMGFLRRCRLGGCLADDMGLGKTVQVLAMLESRRAAGDGVSLVVVPKSLLFNWVEEAKRFTPQLRMLDQTGVERARDASAFRNCDIVLTTYGTLQRDIGYLREIEFDYVILDESQAIKNSTTANAKAVRLLRGRNRLAMSGTPIENRIAELWSLLEFLNPGMLGAASVFKEISSNGSAVAPQVRQVIARAVRPFILRRTKKQVATDLPEKTEQTIHCELEPKHRQMYDDLRAHYRASLLGEVERVGLGKSKIMILEALLRLRQAACHPGLVNPQHRDMPAAKVETLLDQLREVTAEGHKALVFSQFVSFLSIVRERIGTEIKYEYLDGQTRDRQACVDRFQNDPECKLFLISLKAGGVGLNLTAAEYVYLLDPWWNPAVEAQAIDRTHRIGQTRAVFAYRLIAQDTVEEKVLKLQEGKRELAEAIINGDTGVMGNLRKEDLELLLS